MVWSRLKLSSEGNRSCVIPRGQMLHNSYGMCQTYCTSYTWNKHTHLIKYANKSLVNLNYTNVHLSHIMPYHIHLYRMTHHPNAITINNTRNQVWWSRATSRGAWENSAHTCSVLGLTLQLQLSAPHTH